jgi:hypothetical protein
MKYLSDKTGVPEEHLKTLMDKGVISTSWAGYDDVIYCYNETRKTCKTNEEAYEIVAVKKNLSRTTVYNILHKL